MLYSNIININKFLIYILVLIIISNIAKADFFENITGIIEDNDERLSYGISVNDITNDGNYELVVTGFGTDNLALSYREGVLKNIIKDESLSDSNRRTIAILIKMVTKRFIFLIQIHTVEINCIQIDF